MKHMKWIARGYLKALDFIGKHIDDIFWFAFGCALLGVVGLLATSSLWGLLIIPLLFIVTIAVIAVCYGISRLNDWLQEWSKEDK